MLTPGTNHAFVTRPRVHWLDNLRTCMVFLVVVVHAGGVYESSGRWSLFWIVDDPATTPLSDLLIVLLDLFVMPALFFVSGCLAPQSLATKSSLGFLKAKARRLLMPWLIAVTTLIPLYKVIFLYSRNIPQEHWTTYFHWDALWSQNWLWFLPVLFLFNVLYTLASRAGMAPTRVSLKGAVVCTFLIGWAYSCCMDMFGLRGWTHTVIIDFQNERLLVYFMIFVLGALSSQRKLFVSPPRGTVLRIAVVAAALGPVALYYLLHDKFLAAPSIPVVRNIAGTLSLWLGYHVALYCALFVTLSTFSNYLNGSGRLGRVLNANSYYVYIIHTIVVGALATAFLDTRLPALCKYAIVTVATYAACNVIVAGCRKVIEATLTSRMEVRTMKAITQVMLVAALVAGFGCRRQEESRTTSTPPHVSIHLAALQGHIDAIRQHIEAGSNLDEKDQYGSSPLIIAATFGRTEVARALIDAGADTEVRNNDGATALHVAAFLCRTDIVKILLDNGADKSAANAAGRTALDTVAGPFEDVRVIYDRLGKGLKPLGLRLDYDRIERTRPEIAQMLRAT